MIGHISDSVEERNGATLVPPAQNYSKPEYENQPLRLLCVEDNPADRELLTRILKKAGFQVTLDAVDQPELFRQRIGQRDYEVITCDFNLNSWTAMNALEILRDSGKDIPLIVVSGILGDEAAVECIKQGATDYVLKDRMARLPSAVQRALEAKAGRDEQQKARSALLRSAEQYRMLFDGNPHPMWVFDTGTMAILAVNNAAVWNYGYSSEEFLEMTISDLWTPEDLPRNLGTLEALLSPASQVGPIDTWRHRKKSGQIIEVEVTDSPLKFQDRAARLHQAVDVSERNSLQFQLLQSQKMESLGMLAGGVAHDLNNLLGVILGYGELTLGMLESTSGLRHYIEEIQSAGDCAVSVVRQLLAFSRKQIQQMQMLSLARVIGDMETLLRRLIGEDILMSITTEPHLGTVKADPGQIEQIILNLVVNARDAMPRGGQLTIATSNRDSAEAQPEHGLSCPPGTQVMLEVSDSGCGMDVPTQARIFEPFFTTKDPGKGTGLGLATVYGIVKQSGGCISVHSEPGHGATFRIFLPRVDGAPAPCEAEKESEPVPGGSETILLVEDAGPLREVARQFLRQGGYTVLEAQDGSTALSVALENTSPIHLLLTDVVLPGLSGPQLARELKRANPRLPVLYMSGYTDDALGQHGVLEEGIALLEKPFTRAALMRKVREQLDPAGSAPREMLDEPAP
jgi:two-component system cell cycle sensor histidine kinase/response regulator CckA